MGPTATAGAEERVSFPSRRGNRLAGVLHAVPGMPSVPGVILCHGMESTKEGTKHRVLGERLSALGIAVLRFDFSYVGESEGDFADLTFRGEVEDLGGAWDFFRTRVSGPVGLLGSSMGGAVALLFAATEPAVAAVATIAAVGLPGRILEELRPPEIERWRRDGAFSLGGIRLKKSFLEDVETLDVLAACRSVRCPVLVAHGTQDRVVPIADGEAIAAALGGEARFVAHEGADHRFSKPEHLERLLDEAVEFLASRLRP